MNEKVIPDHVATVLGDGRVIVPSSYVRRLGLREDDRVEVRITRQTLSKRLRERGITGSDVDRICRQQMESRENALTFLSSEGGLAGRTSSASRFRRWLRLGR